MAEMLVEPEIKREIEWEESTEQAGMWKVIIHNDNITPYDFVIVVLVRFFDLNSQDAERITWTAHTEGAALVRVLPLNEAEQRVGQAHFAASLEGFPLTFTIEPE